MRQLKITQQITQRESVSLQKYLHEIGLIPLITAEEEVQLCKRIKDGDELALKKMIESNLRFVISVSKQYQGSGEKLEDLINAGNEGLIIAAKKFDETRGFKFISYAVWWIRQTIMQHLTENSKGIRLPSNKVNLINKIRNVSSTLEQTLERQPTDGEISDALFETYDVIKEKMSPEEISSLIYISAPVSSLDMKLSDESENSVSDMVKSDEKMDVGEKLNQDDLQITLKRVLNKKLTPRERDVITYSFGLFGNTSKTLEEIGFVFDLTRERVRQIREKAIRKLRQHISSKQLREYN